MAALSEANCLRIYGCAAQSVLRLNEGKKVSDRDSFAFRYSQHRRHAESRRIGWEITLEEWIALWSESGKWGARGRSRGNYCMARNWDSGPYKVGNVSIQPVEINCRDGWVKVSKTTDFRECGRRRLGTGRGWTFVGKTKSRPYQVVVRDKYIGSFATQAEAESAYAAATRC